MTAKWPIPRPTEHAALRALDAHPRPLPSVPALMAALIDAVDHRDREGMCLASHRLVQAAAQEVGS